jgi:hypothetical protein
VNKKSGWIVAAILVAILLILLPGMWAWSHMGWYDSSYGMMGNYGMMGRHSLFWLNPMSWLGMGFMWLVPVSILVLLVVGAVSLINSLNKPSVPKPTPPPSTDEHTCANCGKPAQADWSVCPYCGQTLA